MAKVLPLDGGIDAQALQAGLARALAMEQGTIAFRTNLQLGDVQLWFRKAFNGEVTVFVGGGQNRLDMDSGIIDLQRVDEPAPLRFARGTRLETTSTQSYTAGWSAETTGAWLGYLMNGIPTANAGQLAGVVTFPKFRGHLRPGGEAVSFNPKRVAVLPATDPPSWVDSPDDDALVGKKGMCSRVPASIFTGRMRLYVQAMYGRPLYRYGSAQATEPIVSTNPGPTMASSTEPALLLTSYRAPSDETVYPPVSVNSSSGVVFQEGRHYLVNIEGPNLIRYPLRSSAAGEAARKLLIANKDELSTADLERLEAYILAESQPDVARREAVPMAGAGASVNPFSMGYGWHWNWSGTNADIVVHRNFDQGIESGFQYTGMESSHYRVSIAFGEAGAWIASRGAVTENKRWAVHRAFHCITEAQWTGKRAHKITPRRSKLFEYTNAPVYVFYARDELRLVQVSMRRVAEVPRIRTHSYFFASDVWGGPIDELTAGMLNGFCEDAEAVPEYFSASFSCGANSITGLDMPWTASAARVDVTKTGFDYGTQLFDNTFYGTHNFSEGYPAPWDGSPGYTVHSEPNCLLEADGNPLVRWDRRGSSRISDVSSTATIIVPFYDAEAVFMDGTRYVNTTESGITVTTHASAGLGTQATRWVVDDPVAGTFRPEQKYIAWAVGGTTAPLTTDNPPDTAANTVDVSRKLVGIGGVFDALMNDLSSYHDGDLDEAEVSYLAWSGARALQPVVFASGRLAPVGVAVVPTYPALVGWV